jgi:plastocyanin
MPISNDGRSRLMAANSNGEETINLCSRRRFLAQVGTLSVAATALTALLAACETAGQDGQGAGATAAPTAMGTMSMGTMTMGSMAPVLLAVGPAGTPQPDQVFIENFAFQPAELTISVGTEVTWINHDDVPHTVTVLNGHIHQVIQKVEGNITFHTARGTAFPQPAPGTAPAPGPLIVPANQLRSTLGITSVSYAEHKQSLAIVDTTLA